MCQNNIKTGQREFLTILFILFLEKETFFRFLFIFEEGKKTETKGENFILFIFQINPFLSGDLKKKVFF